MVDFKKRSEKFSLNLVLLLVAFLLVIVGFSFESIQSYPPVGRYIVSNLGQFLIILFAVLIARDGIQFFTLKSTLGKSLLFISLGIFSWGIGALLWLYYNLIAKIEIPYPSIADIFFLAIIPLVLVGLFYLLRYAQFKWGVMSTLKLLLLPLLVLILVYSFFIQDKLTEGVTLLTKALNVLYPLGDAVFLSISLVMVALALESAVGRVLIRSLIVLSLGFAFEAIADFSFSYTTTIGTYYSGNWVDFVFALAFFTMGVGMYLLHLDHKRFVLGQ